MGDVGEVCVSISSCVVDIQVDGVWVIVDPEGGRVYALNATGSILWQTIKAGGDWQTVARVLARQTSRTESDVVHDAARFVQDLLRRGVLTYAENEHGHADLPGFPAPALYEPPSIALTLPLESRAGSPLQHEPDPLLDPLSPFRLINKEKKGGN